MSTPIPDLYQVKWYEQHTGKWRYGIVDRFSQSSIDYYNEERCVIVDDAILPERYVLNLDCLTDIPITSLSTANEYYAHVEEQYLIAKGRSDTLPEGLHPGKLFRIPVGDGYAFYVVKKVNKKTVDIEWRGFSADRWTDFNFGVGGRYPRNMIEAWVRSADAYRRIFNRPQETPQPSQP